MLYVVYNDMHDSATTMLMRCKVAVINEIGFGTKWCILCTRLATHGIINARCRPLTKILRLNFPPWPKWTYDTDRATVLLVR